MTTLRMRSSTEGQITALATPVSSSMVMNTTPDAEPGRWRTRITPPTLTRAPSLIPLTAPQETMRAAVTCARRNDIGWPLSESRSVR